MLRFALSAVALVWMLTTTLPAIADGNSVHASDPPKAANAGTTQPAPSAPAWRAQPAEPDIDRHQQDIPIGAGWG